MPGSPLYPHRFRDLGLAADKGIVPTLKERAPLPGSGEAIAGSTWKSETGSGDRFRSSAGGEWPGPRDVRSFCSKANARRRSSSSWTPGAGIRSVTLGSPEVMVPVFIQNDNLRFFRRFQGYSVLKKRIPCLAPIPLPTIMATGVARPRAQGAGDHQHRDSAGQSKTDFLPQKQPDNGGKNGNGDDCRDKDARDFIRNLGNGRLGGRSITDHLNDLKSVVSSPTRVAWQVKKS